MNNEVLDAWLPGLTGKITVTKRYCKSFITKKYVENLILLMVFLNTLILSLEGLLDSKYDQFITLSNEIFTYVFTVEMIIKLYGFGFKGYLKNKFNIFDGTLVLIQIAELFLQDQPSLAEAIKVVIVFRSIRVLRVTRLLRTLKFMKVIIEVIMASLE